MATQKITDLQLTVTCGSCGYQTTANGKQVVKSLFDTDSDTDKPFLEIECLGCRQTLRENWYKGENYASTRR